MSRDYKKQTAEEKIRSYYQSFFMTEPVLFACVNTHELVENNQIKTMRIGNGQIQYNKHFINGLEEKQLRELLIFEAFRILCKHPYERKKPNPIANMTGSNVTVQEYLATHLEMPQARNMFQHLLKKNRTKEQEQFLDQYEDLAEMEDHELEQMTGLSKSKLAQIRDSIPDFDEADLEKRHFEFYYKLVEDNIPELIQDSPSFQKMKEAVEEALEKQKGQGNGDGEGDQEGQERGQAQPSEGDGEEGQGQGTGEQTDGTLADHFDPMNALEQQEGWGEEELLKNDINDAIREAQLSQNWGSVPGSAQGALIASLNPKVDYRGILKKFHASVMSSETRLNRMKPSRRFGFGFPGKKRVFTTRLAFFVDVSGSMTDDILAKGFSIVNKFFKYGIQSVDVYQFDTELKDKGKPLTMDKAKKEIKLLGRGGTDFQCVLDKLADTAEYDGVIIYTDGYSYRPTVPKGMKTKKQNILWLFDREDNYHNAYPNLKGIGRAAFVRSDREY